MSAWSRLLLYALLAVATCAVAGIALVRWLVSPDPVHDPGIRNARNSYRVRPGMLVGEARAIMGPAERTVPSLDPSDGRTIYVYTPPPFASDAIYLSVGPDSTVIGISHGE